MTVTRVAWRNPYTTPPLGCERVLAEFEGFVDWRDGHHPAIWLINAFRQRGIWSYGLCFDPLAGVELKPRRQLPEATKVKIRKLNAHRRFLKRYGFTARHFLDELYTQRGWTWTAEDDAIWERAQKPPKASKVKQLKQAARRKTDNDEFLKGSK